MNDTIKNQIIHEMIATISLIDNRSDLLSIVNSYQDTLSDEELLIQLKEWNRLNSANNS